LSKIVFPFKNNFKQWHGKCALINAQQKHVLLYHLLMQVKDGGGVFPHNIQNTLEQDVQAGNRQTIGGLDWEAQFIFLRIVCGSERGFLGVDSPWYAQCIWRAEFYWLLRGFAVPERRGVVERWGQKLCGLGVAICSGYG
jgi:hypothetical protein